MKPAHAQFDAGGREDEPVVHAHAAGVDEARDNEADAGQCEAAIHGEAEATRRGAHPDARSGVPQMPGDVGDAVPGEA